MNYSRQERAERALAWNNKWLSPAILLLSALLISAALSSWWSMRNNNLFGNGRWIIGKNTGKFVFYTFEFMFQPLGPSGIDLTGQMGFQEILYHEPEGPERKLTRLRNKVKIGDDGYLWLILRKKGERLTAFRFSRKRGYDGGFYHFSPEGELLQNRAFTKELPPGEDGWLWIEVTLRDSLWQCSIDGRDFGAFPETGPEDGYFGFRGSGKLHTGTLIKEASFTFADPEDPSRTWVKKERLDAGENRAYFFLPAFAIALVFLLLRLLRQPIYLRYLREDKSRIFHIIDDLMILFFSVFLFLFPASPSGLAFPAVILLSELINMITVATLSSSGMPAPPGKDYLFSFLILALFLSAVGGFSALKHGIRLGRAERTGPMKLGYVHPEAYILIPGKDSPSGPVHREGRLIIRPGEPFFSGDNVYRDQEISVGFVIPGEATFDVVFQQQSFKTYGDPTGEELPFQRRLLRLTTIEGVPSGLAVNTKNQPAPFLKISGRVKPGEENRLIIRSDDGGTTVFLNGQEYCHAGLKPLGFGETGFMSYDGEVLIQNIDIRAVGVRALAGNLLPWTGFLFPLLAAAIASILFRPGGSVSPGEAAALELSALVPLSLYFVAALFLSPNSLAFLDRDRLVWLDLLLAASAVSHVIPVIILRKRTKYAAWLYNLWLPVFCLLLLLFGWDRLPENHSLRLRLANDAIAPADLLQDNPTNVGPWYSNNRLVGASTYIWKHEFGGESITGKKNEGVLRLMVIGGSQAWGSGAASSAETFAELLERRLMEKGMPVETFNASVNGAGTGRNRIVYEGLLRYFRPDIVVADIGLNDSAALQQIRKNRDAHTDHTLKQFEELLSLVAEDGGEFILVPEPMCGETPLRPNSRLYVGMKEIAGKRNIRIVDAATAMKEKEKDHFVWWDTAHLSPYGHRLMAYLIEPAVTEAAEDLLKRVTKSPTSP